MNKEDLYGLLGLGIGGLGGYFGQRSLDKRRLAGQQAPLTFEQQKELAYAQSGFDKDGNPLGQQTPSADEDGDEEGDSNFVQNIIDGIVGDIDPISPNTGQIEVPFQEGDEFFQEGVLGVDPAEKDDRLLPGDYVPGLFEDFINTYGGGASGIFPDLPQPPKGMTQGDFSVPDIAFTPEGDQYLKNIAVTNEDDPFYTTPGLAGDKNLSFYKEADKLPVKERKKLFKKLIKDEIEKGNISIPKDPSNKSGLMDEEEFSNLLSDMVGQESSYRFLGPDSEKGAVGPMQIMPGTYGTEPGFGVNPITDTQARDPLQNLIFGGNYFSGLTDYYTDKGYRRGQPPVNPDIQRALAAYNFGPGNVNALGLDQLRYEPGADNFIPEETINYLDALGYPLLGAPQGEIPPTMSSREAMQNMQNMILQQELEGTGGGLGLNVSDAEERALKGLTGDIYMDEINRTLDPLYQGTGFNQNVFPNQMNFTDIDEDGNAIYEYIFGPDMDPNITIPFNQGGRVGRQFGGGVDAGKDSPSGDKGLGAGVSSGVAQGLGGRPGGHDASKDDFGKENFGDPVGNDDSFGGDGSGPRPAPSKVEEAETTPAFDPMVDMSSFYGPMYGEDTDVNNNRIPDSQEFGPISQMGMTTDLGPLGTGVGVNTPMGTLGIGADLGIGYGTNFGKDDQGTIGMGYNPMSGQLGLQGTYSFGGMNKGGRVGLDNGGSLTDDITELMNSLSMNFGDNQQMYQLSDADSFLRAEILGDDNPRYNYTVGSSLDSLMPGLSFEAGVMDDAIYGPGMTSPDDYKFFNLKKTF
jgi:hypothetical protein